MTDPDRNKRIDARYSDHLGLFLVRFRDRRKMTQQELADAMGISQGHLSQIEKGANGARQVGLPAMIALRNYLGRLGELRSIDELLGLEKFATADAAPADMSAEMRRLREAVERLTVSRPEQGHPARVPEPPTMPPARRRKES